PLLGLRRRLQRDLPAHALARDERHAQADLHVSCRSRLGLLEPRGLARRAVPGGGRPRLCRQRRHRAAPRRARGRRPVGRVDARVGDDLAAAALQLRDRPRRGKPPAPVGPQVPRRSGRATRMSSRGRVGMVCLIVAEASLFAVFVVAYLFYLGKSLTGPFPKDVLSVPVLGTVCLLSSSVTVALGARALARGSVGRCGARLLVTVLLGAVFLAGTAAEWSRLIMREGLTISTNLFGTTYYS